MSPRAASSTARAWAATGLGERVGAYAELSKFGIVLLVLVSAAAGFMLRAPLGADFPWAHGLVVLAGVMLLSSGASALNQVQERDKDALMARTANRPLPSGRLSHEGTARLILLYASGLTAWSLAAPTFGVGGPVTFVIAALLGGRLMWLAVKFAREPHDQRGWLKLFLFSNFYLLLLFAGMVAERLEKRGRA